MRTPWTTEHDRLLEASAPSFPEPGTADVDRVWSRVTAGFDELRPRRRRPASLIVGSLVAAAMVGTSTVAVAEHHSAHTGRGPVDAEDLRLGGPGERLDSGASDYGRVVSEETADIPFPSEAFRRAAVENQLHDARFDVPGRGSVATGALRAWVADAALCAWSNQWAVATRAGDVAERDEAIGVIRSAPTWPAVVALDPAPYSRIETMEVVDRNGVSHTEHLRDDSQFYYLTALASAVQGDDVSRVAGILAENNGYCRPNLVPDLPAADPLSGAR